MSINAVNAFRQAVNEDPKLQGNFSEAILEGAPAVVSLAASHGYDFSQEDYRQTLASISEESLTPFERTLAAKGEESGELSDYELELVSAGTSTT